MSGYRRISDAPLACGEGRTLTQPGPSAFSRFRPLANAKAGVGNFPRAKKPTWFRSHCDEQDGPAHSQFARIACARASFSAASSVRPVSRSRAALFSKLDPASELCELCRVEQQVPAHLTEFSHGSSVFVAPALNLSEPAIVRTERVARRVLHHHVHRPRR